LTSNRERLDQHNKQNLKHKRREEKRREEKRREEKRRDKREGQTTIPPPPPPPPPTTTHHHPTTKFYLWREIYISRFVANSLST